MSNTPDPERVDRVPDEHDQSDVVHRFPSLKVKIATLPEDEWDGMCDLDFEMAPRTDDDEVVPLVLFADVEFTDPDAVAERVREWRELFGEGGNGGS